MDCSEHQEFCSECHGSGACDPCDGYGFYPDSHPDAGDGPECDRCNGSGRCPECHGDGISNDSEIEDIDTEEVITS